MKKSEIRQIIREELLKEGGETREWDKYLPFASSSGKYSKEKWFMGKDAQDAIDDAVEAWDAAGNDSQKIKMKEVNKIVKWSKDFASKYGMIHSGMIFHFIDTL